MGYEKSKNDNPAPPVERSLFEEMEWISRQLDEPIDLANLPLDELLPIVQKYRPEYTSFLEATQKALAPMQEWREELTKCFGSRCVDILGDTYHLTRCGNRKAFECDVEAARRLWRSGLLRVDKFPISDEVIKEYSEWLETIEQRLPDLDLEYDQENRRVKFRPNGRGQPMNLLTLLAEEFIARTGAGDTLASRERMAGLLRLFFDENDLKTRATDPIGVALSNVCIRERKKLTDQ